MAKATAQDVDNLFMEYLGRPADPEGSDFYSGKDIAQVAADLAYAASTGVEDKAANQAITASGGWDFAPPPPPPSPSGGGGATAPVTSVTPLTAQDLYNQFLGGRPALEKDYKFWNDYIAQYGPDQAMAAFDAAAEQERNMDLAARAASLREQNLVRPGTLTAQDLYNQYLGGRSALQADLDFWNNYITVYGPDKARAAFQESAEPEKKMPVEERVKSLRDQNLTVPGSLLGEFATQRKATPAEVRSMYLSVLGREPDPEGFSYYTSQPIETLRQNFYQGSIPEMEKRVAAIPVTTAIPKPVIGQVSPQSRGQSVDIPGSFVTTNQGAPKPLTVDISTMPREQQDLTSFIVGKMPRPTTTSPGPMFTPGEVNAQLELERLKAMNAPTTTDQGPVAGFAEGGLVGNDINRMLQNQRNAVMRESQSRQMLTNMGAPPVKKFSNGGPAGSSSGVRRLEMSKIRKRQEGSPPAGEITNDDFIQEMMTGTRPSDFPETSPVDTAVSDFISSRSKLVTDPREFFRVMGQNLEEYHGKPLREDPEKYLMEQLGPGALAGIIKPKGGNVVTQDLMESLKSLRPSVLYEGYRPASEADKLIREQMKKEEESGRGISASTKRIFEENKPKAALDDWIQNKLGRYIRTEMGSEDDPVRKLGEEMTEKIRSAYETGFKRIAKMKDKIAEAKAMGKNTDISEAELADEINRVENAYRQTSKLPVDQGPYLYPRSRTGRAREKAGFSPYPISKSDAGKEWEGTADALFEVHKAGDLVKQNSPLLFDNPWIAKLDPKEIVYQPKNVDEPAMFTHTIDELENALNPNSGLPQNLLLKPEDMQQLSIDKAFRHVNKINDWRTQQRTAANLQEAQLAAVTYKEYPGSTGKLKWQELKAPEYTELPSGYRLEDMDYGTAMLKDAQGNILTYIDKMNAKGAVDPLKQALSFLSRNDLERALKYEGSTMRRCVGKFCDPVFLGQTRVFSLRDSKGEPHITIETAPPRTTTETVDQFFKENPSLKRAEGLDDFQYANSPAFPWKEYNQWLKSQPEEVRQVKGKGNDKPSARYIEFGQDFIASKNWSDIQDLENLDIVPLKPMMLKNAQERGFNPQILTTVKDQPYITKQEFNRLADLFGGMNKYAAGGEVTDFIKRAA